MQDPKLSIKLHDFFFNKEGLISGDEALKKIVDQHNNIILNQFNNKAIFGKHYSVNIKPSIM